MEYVNIKSNACDLQGSCMSDVILILEKITYIYLQGLTYAAV